MITRENNAKIPKDPCILVDDLTVYIISGIASNSKSKKYIKGTWIGVYDKIQVYDRIPKTNTTKVEWTFVSNFPRIGRQSPTCYVDGDDIVVIGGDV